MKAAIGLLFVIISVDLSFAQEIDYKKSLQDIIRKHRIPGISLAYFDGDTMIHTLQAWLPHDTLDSEVDDKTVFSAASLSKPVTAYITLRMVAKGKIDLDKPLADYFEYPDLKGQPHYKKVTARMVLTHTSGLPNWRDEKLTFIHTPNEKFSYSGEGFYWLQNVLAAIEKKPFQTLADELVFQPLDMRRSSFVWKPEFEGNHALPHNTVMVPQQKRKMRKANAAGSLQTTASDYAKFMKELMVPQFLPVDIRNEMIKEQVAVKSYKKGEHTISWGLGIGLQETAGGPECWHWGNNGSFRAFFTFSPDLKKGVVYFTNSQNGLAMTDKVTDLFLGTPQPGYKWNGFKGQGKLYRLGSIFKKKGISR